ncbi:hypothetical protein BSKO_10076 [Bryopsis sp. KO-2023]|nr:hypothetical protein BSKO_10076 [Bryopsis sp. KO-2023]
MWFRLQVRELTASIRMGAFVKAVNVIQQNPEVLFRVEEDCFGYPVHLACALGETHLAQHMLILAKAEGKDLATFLDARGNNPIQMAQAHGQRKCVEKLTQFLKEQSPAILPPNPQVVPRAAFSKVKVAPPPPPPQPEVKPTSNPNVIENTQRICLQSEKGIVAQRDIVSDIEQGRSEVVEAGIIHRSSQGAVRIRAAWWWSTGSKFEE